MLCIFSFYGKHYFELEVNNTQRKISGERERKYSQMIVQKCTTCCHSHLFPLSIKACTSFANHIPPNYLSHQTLLPNVGRGGKLKFTLLLSLKINF